MFVVSIFVGVEHRVSICGVYVLNTINENIVHENNNNLITIKWTIMHSGAFSNVKHTRITKGIHE